VKIGTNQNHQNVASDKNRILQTNGVPR